MKRLIVLGTALLLGMGTAGLPVRAEDKKDAVDELVKTLTDKDDNIRLAAGDALALFGGKAVPPLVETLKDESVELRLHAARSLAQIGHEAKAAIPALATLLNQKDNAALVNAAATALGKVGKSSIPV